MFKKLWQFVFGNPVVKEWGDNYPTYIVKHLEAAKTARDKGQAYLDAAGYVPSSAKDNIKSALTKASHELGKYNESRGVGPNNIARKKLAEIRSQVAKMRESDPHA